MQASARALNADVAGAGLRAHRPVDAADCLVARPGLRIEPRVCRYHQLITDAHVAIVGIVVGVTDPDDVAGLCNGRCCLDPADALRAVNPVARACADTAGNLHAITASGADVDVARSGAHVELDRARHSKRALERTAGPL